MWCDFSVQQRYVLTALLFTGMLFAYLERSCLSMAITQMVKPIDDVVIKTDETVCPARETESPATNTSIIAVSTESTVCNIEHWILLAWLIYLFISSHIER